MNTRIFLAVIVFFVSFSTLSFADSKPLPMNKITMRLMQEKWATTDTAKVIVNVAAVLDRSGLAKTHQTINENLKKISDKGEWHITQFNRMKDPSGLEKLNIRAEARVPESDLTGLRDRAKSVSRPGEKYTIAAIAFTPSVSDIEKTKEAVRNQIYTQANQELARVNKEYGTQKYFIHSINFVPGAMPMPIQKARPRMMMTAQVSADSGLVISDKVRITALVEFAAKND